MKSRHRLMSTTLIALGVVCIVPATARAYEEPQQVDTTDPYAPITSEGAGDHVRSGIGVEMSVGGGISNFTNTSVNNVTDPAGTWEARLGIGSRSFFGLEGAYIGQAGNVGGLGLESDTLLQAHGAEGLLRFNILPSYVVQPYLFAGAAWKHYSLLFNNNFTSSVRDSDDVVEVPFGGGVAFRSTGFVFDTRFDYRPAFDEEMFRINGQTRSMDNWEATARLGFEF